MDKEKVIQSLGKMDIDKVIYLTASMHIKGNDWVHGEAVRSFMDSGRTCIEYSDGAWFHYTAGGAWY